ncbi:MAG: SLBB domain-containing protein [Tannerellaceae bacterium]|nr:SLBB domain-containing protein [Tannerellaceae bacterium]
MKTRFLTCFSVICLLLSAGLHAQVSQEWIDKAKAGMTDTRIRPAETHPGTPDGDREAAYGREVAYGRETASLEEQRIANLPGTDVKEIVFGREIFTNKQLTFAPDFNAPTPKDYLLSAGDELAIHVWGDSELNLRLTVSPDGTIIIPGLGQVTLSGLTVEEAGEHIRRELGRIMSGLTGGSGARSHVSVGLSRIRSIKVHIVGEAVAPGTYTLPSFATLFNALYAAGGVNDIGSLRNVRVFRRSREVTCLDVYDYLLRGLYDTNIRLEDNDMIMIDTYAQLVSVRGKVKRNRMFELRKGETLKQLLDMAGGFTGDACTEYLRIKRKAGVQYQLATVAKERFDTFVMCDGDSCMVDSVIPFYQNRLLVTGAVWRPGEYELSGAVHTVRQLIGQAAGLKGDEFAGRAQIIRLNADFTHTIIAVDLRTIFNGTAPDVGLQAEDRLHIPSLSDLREPYTIRVCGAVNASDTVFPYKHNMTVEDAVVLAGGLRESAATIHVEVARRIKAPASEAADVGKIKEYHFTLSDGMQILPEADTLFTLEPFDEVYVRFSPGYQAQQVIRVEGEVMFAGNYALTENETRLSDIIRKAGGVTAFAYTKGANLKRRLTEDELRRMETLMEISAKHPQSDEKIEPAALSIRRYPVGIDLHSALASPGSEDDLILKDGDELYIPQYQGTVKISGSVAYPNSVAYGKNMTVRHCLSQAGGYDGFAYKYPIVIYMNGKVATTRRTLIFFKHYPKVEPGCEIIIPSVKQKEKTNLLETLSMGSSITSIAAMVMSMINTISK